MKRIGCAAILALTLFTLAACGGQAGGAPVTAAPQRTAITAANAAQLVEQPTLPEVVTWVSALDFNPDASLLAVGDQSGGGPNRSGMRVIRMATGEELTHVGGNLSAAFSPDGKLLATAGFGAVWIYDLNTSEQISAVDLDDWGNDVAFSPQRGTLAISTGLNSFRESGILVYDIQSEQTVFSAPTADASSKAVAISPDGSKVAGGMLDGQVILWNVDTSAQIAAIAAHTAPLASVEFSPDGASVVSGADDDVIRVWDAATGEMQIEITGHTDNIAAAIYSLDGSVIISGSHDGTMRLWDAATGVELFNALIQIEGGFSRPRVTALALSDDGGLVAAGVSDGSVHFFEIGTGQ